MRQITYNQYYFIEQSVDMFVHVLSCSPDDITSIEFENLVDNQRRCKVVIHTSGFHYDFLYRISNAQLIQYEQILKTL